MSVQEQLTSIHELGPVWSERSAMAEQERQVSPDTAAELQATGAHQALQPTDFGGRQDSIESHMRLVSGVGEYCTATSWCTAVWSAHNWMLSLFPEQAQKDVWDDPTALVSASIVPKTRFKADGEDVLVQGRFSFASGCDRATWFGVGGIVEFGKDRTGPVICMLPASDAVIDDKSWEVVGLAGTGSKDLVIDQPLRIPAHRVLFTPDAMARQAPGQFGEGRDLYRAPYRATATIVLAAPAVGTAKAALKRFVSRLDERVMMHSQVDQKQDPLAAQRVAESSADTNAAELVLLDAARRLDRMGFEEEPDPVDVASIFRDTAYGVRLCAQAVDRLYEASGGSSLQADEPMQRYWRDVHAARSHAILTWDAAATIYSRARLG